MQVFDKLNQDDKARESVTDKKHLFLHSFKLDSVYLASLILSNVGKLIFPRVKYSRPAS